ncbi:hypothetical protein JCM5350_002963 [Sporobolomyces pararoseus]
MAVPSTSKTRSKQTESTTTTTPPVSGSSKRSVEASETPQEPPAVAFTSPKRRKPNRSNSLETSNNDNNDDSTAAEGTKEKGKGRRKKVVLDLPPDYEEKESTSKKGKKKIKKRPKNRQPRGKGGAFTSTRKVAEEQVNGVEEEGNNEPEAVHAEEVQGNPSQSQASPLSRPNGSNLSDNDADEEEEEGDELSSEEEKGAGSDDEPEVVTPRIVRKLESDLESTAFTRISCKSFSPPHFNRVCNTDIDLDPHTVQPDDPSGSGPIRIGDVVELASSKTIRGKVIPTSAGYLGVVEEIRALNTDLSEVTDEDGRPIITKGGKVSRTVSKLYVKVGWLYAKKDFRDMRDDWKAFREQAQVMGPNERVKTDSTDWDVQTNLILHHRPELIYLYDDCYPAPNASGKTSAHPLDFFSTSKLEPLCTSDYAKLAFTTRMATDPPGSARKPIRSRGDQSAYYVLPYFYFGVTSTDSLPPTGRLRRPLPPSQRPPLPEELFANGSNIKDGLQEITYVRTAYSWTHQPPSEGSGDQLSEEDKRVWKKLREDKNDREPKKLWPLTFSLHSDPPKPYDPLSIQHYSRKARKWYDITDLHRLRSYRVQPEDEESGASQLSISAVNSNGNSEEEGGSQSVLARALLEDSDPSSDEEQASYNSAKNKSEVDMILKPLIEAAKSPIVRGASYGLTGNCYLVSRASWLLHYYNGAPSTSQPLLPCPEDLLSAPTPFEWIQKSQDLSLQLDMWEDGIEARTTGEGQGEGLKQAWSVDEEVVWRKIRRAEEDTIKDEDELEWLCPECHEPI